MNSLPHPHRSFHWPVTLLRPLFLVNNLLEVTSSVQTQRCHASRSWRIKCNQEVRGLPSKTEAGQKSEVSFLPLMLYLFPFILISLPILFPQAHRWPFFCVNLFLSVLAKWASFCINLHTSTALPISFYYLLFHWALALRSMPLPCVCLICHLETLWRPAGPCVPLHPSALPGIDATTQVLQWTSRHLSSQGPA